jgi:hypothetical protein
MPAGDWRHSLAAVRALLGTPVQEQVKGVWAKGTKQARQHQAHKVELLSWLFLSS